VPRARIICIGNRLVGEDAAGPRVHTRLQRLALPAGVELVDGGLGGLKLLPLLERVERVVFVDSVLDGARAPVAAMNAAEVAALARGPLDHAAGLPYLLRVLPAVCDGPAPDVVVVGVESNVDDERTLDEAALLALRLAVDREGNEGWARSSTRQTD
jgi:hydrogenase maturation protease